MPSREGKCLPQSCDLCPCPVPVLSMSCPWGFYHSATLGGSKHHLQEAALDSGSAAALEGHCHHMGPLQEEKGFNNRVDSAPSGRDIGKSSRAKDEVGKKGKEK